jgi:hypothetical protein
MNANAFPIPELFVLGAIYQGVCQSSINLAIFGVVWYKIAISAAIFGAIPLGYFLFVCYHCIYLVWWRGRARYVVYSKEGRTKDGSESPGDKTGDDNGAFKNESELRSENGGGIGFTKPVKLEELYLNISVIQGTDNTGANTATADSWVSEDEEGEDEVEGAAVAKMVKAWVNSPYLDDEEDEEEDNEDDDGEANEEGGGRRTNPRMDGRMLWRAMATSIATAAPSTATNLL